MVSMIMETVAQTAIGLVVGLIGVLTVLTILRCRGTR